MNGRHWIFLSNGTNIVYTSSTDGVTWDSATTVRSGTATRYISCCHDGTYFHYVYGADSVSSLYYRRGTLDSGGGITWSAVEQTITLGTTAEAPQATICVDSGGYAFVIYVAGVSGSSTAYPTAMKNANTDGTWSNAASYPVTLKATSSTAWEVGCLIVGGKPLAMYGTNQGSLLAKLYDSGITWGSEETATQGTHYLEYGYTWSAGVDSSDYVYVAYTCYSDRDVYVLTRNPGTGTWSESSALETSTAATNQCQIAVLPNGDLWVFLEEYPSADNLYYKKRVSGSWDGSWTSFTTETNMRDTGRIACTNDVKNGKIDIYYQAGSGSPYTHYFAGTTVSGEETASTIYMNYLRF